MTISKKNTYSHLLLLGFILSLCIGVYTRFVGLTSFPPSLYWEEAALGYDAFAILKTGHDLHGHFLPVVAFESFGDYKPSFYFYTLVPSIAFFGLTDFAVRFPSALSGLLLIIGIGLIAKEIFKEDEKFSQQIQIIAMLITSLSPWAIQFSRGGWEVNLATALLTFGMWLQLSCRRSLLNENIKPNSHILFKLILGTFLVGLSMYTYHATRLISPLLLLGVWLDTFWNLWRKKNVKVSFISFLKTKPFSIILAGLFFTVFVSPILLSLRSVETQQRFAETSLFADGRQVKLSNELIDHTQPEWLGKIIYHRDIIGAKLILENYLSHFSFKFLFLNGDVNPRHSTQFVGLMYTGESLFFLAGIYFLFKKRNSLVVFLVFWLFVGIMPASLTMATPHALRILPSLPVWMIILSCGAFQIGLSIMQLLAMILNAHKMKYADLLPFVLTIFIFTGFYAWEFGSYWRFYSTMYSKMYESEWQYGYKEMVTELEKVKVQNPSLPVQITREYGRPSTYYWFYTQVDPKSVQAEESAAKKDQGEFKQYKNIQFVDQVSVNEKTLIASTPESYEDVKSKHSATTLLHTVYDLQNKPIWVIYIAE